RARALCERKTGRRNDVARLRTRRRHAAGIESRDRTLRLAYRDLAFEVQAEGRDQVGAGNQGVLVDEVAHGGRFGASRLAAAAVNPTFRDGREVHVQVQDGIDVDEVRRPTGNLVTRATCGCRVGREFARRHRSWSGVVAERDRRAFALQEVLWFHE